MTFLHSAMRKKQKMYPTLFCFDKEREKSFSLFEQLLRRLVRGKVILSVLCSFASSRQREMLQRLRVVPPKIALCCGNFSPAIMRPLASQD